jgi:hypothetical protein
MRQPVRICTACGARLRRVFGWRGGLAFLTLALIYALAITLRIRLSAAEFARISPLLPLFIYSYPVLAVLCMHWLTHYVPVSEP